VIAHFGVQVMSRSNRGPTPDKFAALPTCGASTRNGHHDDRVIWRMTIGPAALSWRNCVSDNRYDHRGVNWLSS
jgi:hypothetical protein